MIEAVIEPKTINQYALCHTMRGMCQCGECIDAFPMPLDEMKNHTNIHTTEVGFFEVSLQDYEGKKPNKERFIELLKEHKGEFMDIDIFDGKEHSFIELGGYFGDQQIALRIMGLGKLLGVWQLLTPKAMFGNSISEELKIQMAQQGLVTIAYRKEEGIFASAK